MQRIAFSPIAIISLSVRSCVCVWVCMCVSHVGGYDENGSDNLPSNNVFCGVVAHNLDLLFEGKKIQIKTILVD